MTVQEDQEVGFKSSKLFGDVCCWCWKRLFPASEQHEGQGEGNCFVRQRESGDNFGAPCWAAHGSCWESWLIARLIFFEHPKGFTLIHFPAVSRALCSNVQSTAHLHVRFGFHAVFNLLVRDTCAYLWGIWHCLSMFVILWCFCGQARCKLFLRLGRGGSATLKQPSLVLRWFGGGTHVLPMISLCHQGPSWGMNWRKAVKRWLICSRNWRMGRTREVKRCLAKMTALFWFCFVCFISPDYTGLFQLWLSKKPLQWYCLACCSVQHPRIFNLRSQRRELEEERYSALLVLCRLNPNISQA